MSVLIFATLASAQSTFVPNGSALIPGMSAKGLSSTNYDTCHLFISNISDNAVQCRVTVFDHDGNDVSHYCRLYTGGASEFTLLSTGVSTFEIPAHSTRDYDLYDSTMPAILGYGIIEWEGIDKYQRKSLIAATMVYGRRTADAYFSSKFPINNGQPF